MIIRKAIPDDFEALRAIYNYEAEFTDNNFDTHAIEADEWAAHMSIYNKEGDNHPLLVADDNGVVCGYASLSPFRSKHGYAESVELSIYVARDHRGRGLGNMLMAAIVESARSNPGTHLIVSVVTSENAASMALHTKFNFEYCGCIREAAFKRGAYHNINYYQLLV